MFYSCFLLYHYHTRDGEPASLRQTASGGWAFRNAPADQKGWSWGATTDQKGWGATADQRGWGFRSVTPSGVHLHNVAPLGVHLHNVAPLGVHLHNVAPQGRDWR